jgi:hypothetical protein
MHGNLRGRQREYQPTSPGIDRPEFQHITQEGTIGLRIVAVQKKVCPVDHASASTRSVALNTCDWVIS